MWFIPANTMIFTIMGRDFLGRNITSSGCSLLFYVQRCCCALAFCPSQVDRFDEIFRGALSQMLIAANEYSSAIGVCVKWKENMTSPFAVPATHENQLPVVITVADCHFLHSSSRAFTLREMITKSERRSHPTSKHRERAAAVAARHYGQIN